MLMVKRFNQAIDSIRGSLRHDALQGFFRIEVYAAMDKSNPLQ
jgi:hypothetical protein